MSFPMGDRIVLDPGDLRQLATRMRGASVILSVAGREVATRPLPAMSSGVASAVTEVIRRANAELQELAVELLHEAGELFARATWAELGGGEAVAWLIPGFHRAPSALHGASASAVLTPASALPPVSERQLVRSGRWAISLLDEMEDPRQVLDERTAEAGGEVDDVLGSDLIKSARAFAEENPVERLGAFISHTGEAFGLYEHHGRGLPEAQPGTDASAGAGAAGGVLGVAFSGAALGPTGAGLVGCLVVGGAAASQGGDQLDEGVLE